jgi:hypothetical protein
MTGWEATDYMGHTSSPTAFLAWQNDILNNAVDLGINRIRVEIYSGIENSTDWFQLYLNGQITGSVFNSHAYEIVNDNTNANSINPSGFKWSRLDFTMDNVVIPLRNRLAARGETLWIHLHYLTDNYQPNSQFHRDNPNEYAEFVLAVYQHLQSRYGIIGDSWTIVNEPDNPGVFWSGDNGALLGTMTKVAGDKLVANGFTPAFLLPGTVRASFAASFFDNAIAVSGARPYVTGLDYHRYAETVTDSMISAVGDRARDNNLKSGMTEHIGADYQELYKDLTLGRCSFWQQYTLASAFGGDDGGKYFPIDLTNPNNPVVSIGSRTKFLRQYFKFIRLGAVRVGASSISSNLEPVAFRNTNGKYVVVVKANAASGNFTIGGLPAGIYGIKYTTSTAYDQNAPDQTIGAGQNITTSIPGAGVITVYWKAAPTAIKLRSTMAAGYNDGILVQWQTGYEIDNLGFNVYREVSGQRTLITPEMIAGSALTIGSGTALKAGCTYRWWDKGAEDHKGAVYYLEDIDLSGERTLHGPIKPIFTDAKSPVQSKAMLLSQVGRGAIYTQRPPTDQEGVAPQQLAKTVDHAWELASKPAIKMIIKEEGWYRVPQAELVAAGLDPKADPRNFRLYVAGVEQPLLVVGEKDGSFDKTDAIEFYASGQDRPFADAHVYWLAVTSQPGKRINTFLSKGSSGGLSSFLHTLESRPKSIYFPNALNGDAENFFGPVIVSQPLNQPITLNHVDTANGKGAEIEVALQGVTDLPGTGDHRVRVALNGVYLGTVIYDGRMHKAEKFSLNQAMLKEGENVITLTAEAGGADVNLLDYLRVTYWHTPMADDNSLKLNAQATIQPVGGFDSGNSQIIGGFTSPLIRIFDITDPATVTEIIGRIDDQGSTYAVTFGFAGQGSRTVLTLTEDRIKQPADMTVNQPSHLRSENQGADFVMITRREFYPALQRLKALRQSQRLDVALVDIEDIFDEFSYGEKNPESIKEFLSFAAANWKKKPRYVLLAGDASFDPKNYLRLGDTDIVPTMLLDTASMETASDDRFADFNDDGLAEMAVGRLPFRSTNDAEVMVSKIIAYERSKPSQEVTLAADINDSIDFESASWRLLEFLPGNLKINQIYRSTGAGAKTQLTEAIQRGQKIVNYTGHGSVNQWRGNLLTSEDVEAWVNSDHLPLFVMMACLNGYFQDSAFDSLAETLMKAEKGGAIAVWASSGITSSVEQSVLNQQLYQMLFMMGGNEQRPTLGEAVIKAKASVIDPDVRRTWILFGDPTIKLK